MAELSTSAKVVLVVVGLFLVVNIVGGVLLARALRTDQADRADEPTLTYCQEWHDELARVPGVRPTEIARRLRAGDVEAAVDAQFFAFFAPKATAAVQAATQRFDRAVTQAGRGRSAPTLDHDAQALERAIVTACG